MRRLQQNTLSNHNISSDLLAATYTADADRALLIRVAIDQVAGNGDYSAYVTLQQGGSGSAYKTHVATLTAASGVTAILFPSVMLAVDNTDVVKVYVKGLAGDTSTPDITVNWYELSYLRPTVAGRTLDVATTGEAGLDFDNIKQATSATTLYAGIWSYATRTLTQTATQVAATYAAGVLPPIIAGVSYSTTTTGLTIPADWAIVWLTIKADEAQSDTEAIVQLVASNPAAGTDGLKYLNGAAATSALLGSLTVDQAGGSVTMALTAAATVQLERASALGFDVKVLSGTDTVTLLASGTASVQLTETKSIA